MLPAFHRERIAGYRATMEEEAQRALEGRYDGELLDVYGWARALALRVAMRALFGFDPDAGRGAPTRRATSSARSPSTARTTGCRCCAARARRTRG